MIAIYLSRMWLQLAEFPEQPDLGAPLAAGVSAFTDWLVERGVRVHRRARPTWSATCC